MEPVVPAPGPVLSPELLRQVDELHALVRAWAEVGSQIGNVPMPLGKNPTVDYVDLMFAYGLARMGEVQRSTALADTACAALDALPAESDKGMAARFLARAFRYRIDEATCSHPPSSQLSPALLDDLNEIDRKSGGNANSPPGMAHFVINRLREQSRILEPFERIDLYKKFTTPHEGGLKRALYNLIDERDPVRLANCIRELYRREGAPDRDGRAPVMTDQQFDVLLDCLPLSARCGGAFAAELIRLVPQALRQQLPQKPEAAKKQTELLERALLLAGYFNHRELAVQLVVAFTELVEKETDDARLGLFNRVTETCVRCLRQLGLRDDLDKLLSQFQTAVLGRGSMSDMKQRYSNQPEQWLNALLALLSIAGGWLTLGLTEPANPILDEARAELHSPPGRKPMPQDDTRLAKAYIAAIGHGPAESGLQRIAELFRKIDPAKITNSFVTAPFYSRLHLNVAEEVVLASLQILAPAPSPTSR